MALPRQLIPIDFTGGLDKSLDEKLALPGKLLTLDNAVFRGANTIRKRDGYTQVTTTALLNVTGATLADGWRLHKRGEELLVEANSGLHALIRDSAGGLRAGQVLRTRQSTNSVSGFIRCVAKARDVLRQQADITCFDAAAGNGTFFGLAWLNADGTLHAGIWDASTQTMVVRSPTDGIATGRTACRITYDVTNQRFRVYAANGSSIVMYTHDALSGTTGGVWTSTTVLTDTASSLFDVVYDTPSDRTFLAYVENGGGNLKIRQLTGGSVTAASRTEAGATPTRCIAICMFSSGKVCVGYTNAGGYGIHTYPAALGSTLSTGAAGNYYGRIVAATSGSNALVLLDEGTASSTNFDTNRQIGGGVVNDSAVVVTSTVVARSLGLASKPFSVDGRMCVAGVFAGTINTALAATAPQGTLFVLQVDEGNGVLTTTTNRPIILARVLQGAASAQATHPPNVAAGLADGRASVFAFRRGEFQLAAGTDTTPDGIAEVELNFNHASIPTVETELGGGLYFAGGCPLYYDGIRVSETGFHTAPDDAFVTATPSAGGSLSAGTYQVRVGWEVTDAQGRRWYSLFSTAKSFTAALGDKVTVVCPMDRLTRRGPGEQRVVVFRTKVGGTTFYRDTPSSGSDANVTTSNTTSLVFTTADTDLQKGELLPTTGNVLDSEPFPAHRLSCVYQKRLFMAGCENPYALRYTDALVDGFAPSANEVYELTVPPDMGAVTGLGVMDDKLVVSCARGTWYFFGTGPNRLGLQNGFSDAQIAVREYGCREDSAAMAASPDGLWFRSEQGLRLLTRGLALARGPDGAELGSEVDILLLDSRVVAALLVKGQSQVRFYTGAIVLVWDFQWGQWSRFTAPSTYEAQDAVEWNDAVTHLRSDGTLYAEGGTNDAGTNIVMEAVTSWLKLASVQGFQRVTWIYLLGTPPTDGQLNLQLAYDYDGTYEGGFSAFDVAPLGQLLQLRHKPARQKCEAIKLRIYDGGANDGEGFQLSNLTLEVGVKRGGFKRLAGTTGRTA